MDNWFFSHPFLPYILPAGLLQASEFLTTALEDSRQIKLHCVCVTTRWCTFWPCYPPSRQLLFCLDAILITLESLGRHTFYMINRENTFFSTFWDYMLLQQNFPPLLVNYKINIINIFYKFENEWGNRFQDF